VLELEEPAGVDQPGDDLAHVVGRAVVGGDHAVELIGVDRGLRGGMDDPRRFPVGGQGGHDRAHDLQGVGVVLRQVVGDPGRSGVQFAATQLLGGDDLARGRFHQRRAAQEDRALVAHDHGLVAHRRHVGAARGARPEHGRHLGDAGRRQAGLVVEDAAEVVSVGEDLVLLGEERAAGVDQVDAGEAVVERDLLRPEVLLDGDGVVGAALDGGVVGHDHAPLAGDDADAGDDAGGRHLVAVHAVGGQRRQLQERRSGVEQGGDPVAGQELASCDVPCPRGLRAAAAGPVEPGAQVGDQFVEGLDVLAVLLGGGVDGARQLRGRYETN